MTKLGASALFFFVFNGFFLAELIRKYAVNSIYPVLLYELIVLFIGLVFVLRNYRNFYNAIFLIALSIIAWACLTAIITSQYSWTFLAGMRGVALPLAFLVVAMQMVRLKKSRVFERTTFLWSLFWISVLTCLALAQLAIGPHSFITLGAGWQSDAIGEGGLAYGLGSWGAGIQLFRTTAIFEHTGKYGQIIFILCTYSAYYRYKSNMRASVGLPILCLEIFAVFLTGQRSALVFYMLVLAVLNSFTKWQMSAIIATLVGFIVFVLFTMPNIAARYPPLIGEVWLRAHQSGLIPMHEAIDRFPVFGMGFGSLSFGSHFLGGTTLANVLTEGIPENSYARMVVELGVPGLLLYVVLFACIGVAAWKQYSALKFMGADNRQTVSLCAYAGILLVCLSIWANFHDVLGATATVGFAFLFCAPLWAPMTEL